MNSLDEQEAIKLLYGEGCTCKEVSRLRRLRQKYHEQTDLLDQNADCFAHLQFLRWLIAMDKMTEWPA